MNILYHHRTQGKGAEGVHIREIVKAFTSLGHTIHMASPWSVEASSVREIEVETRKPAIGWGLSLLSRSVPQIVFEFMELIYNIEAAKNVSRILRKEKIDMVYERYAFYCRAGVKAGVARGIPVVLEVNEISGIRRVRGQVLKSLAKRIEIRNFLDASLIVVVSKFLKQQIVSMGVPDTRVIVVPNGVNLDDFVPDTTCKKKDKIVLGFVGRFVAWHDFPLMLNMFQALVSRIEGIELMLVGEGPLRNQIEKWVKARNLVGKVLLAGAFPHSQIPQVINQMDICLIPHTNEYRSPIKLFEYMAMAKPVIAPRMEPIEAVTTDGEDAMLFEAGDETEFGAKVELLLADEELRTRIGQNARRKIENHHTWETNARTIITSLTVGLAQQRNASSRIKAEST